MAGVCGLGRVHQRAIGKIGHMGGRQLYIAGAGGVGRETLDAVPGAGIEWPAGFLDDGLAGTAVKDRWLARSPSAIAGGLEQDGERR
jgi:hypothetical protein